jgi:hypothetical protein
MKENPSMNKLTIISICFCFFVFSNTSTFAQKYIAKIRNITLKDTARNNSWKAKIKMAYINPESNADNRDFWYSCETYEGPDVYLPVLFTLAPIKNKEPLQMLIFLSYENNALFPNKKEETLYFNFKLASTGGKYNIVERQEKGWQITIEYDMDKL